MYKLNSGKYKKYLYTAAIIILLFILWNAFTTSREYLKNINKNEKKKNTVIITKKATTPVGLASISKPKGSSGTSPASVAPGAVASAAGLSTIAPIATAPIATAPAASFAGTSAIVAPIATAPAVTAAIFKSRTYTNNYPLGPPQSGVPVDTVGI